MPNTTNKTRTLSEGGDAARPGIVKALDKASEADPFLGDVIEIAIVTRDHKRAFVKHIPSSRFIPFHTLFLCSTSRPENSMPIVAVVYELRDT